MAKQLRMLGASSIKFDGLEVTFEGAPPQQPEVNPGEIDKRYQRHIPTEEDDQDLMLSDPLAYEERVAKVISEGRVDE